MIRRVTQTRTNGPRGTRGRQPLTDLQIAVRNFTYAEKAFAEASAEFNALVDEKNPELVSIAKKRIALTKKIDALAAESYDLSRKENKTDADIKKLNELKEGRISLYAKLNSLPDLGVSQKEWDETPDEYKKKESGRPRLSLEAKYYRAMNALSETKKALYIEQEKAGIKKNDIVQIAKEEKQNIAYSGRPDGGLITALEKSIRLTQKKIDDIDSGKYAKEMEAKLMAREITAKNTTMGRPFEDLKTKRARLVDKIRGFQEEIKAIEESYNNYLYVQRLIVVARRNINEQADVLVENNIDFPDLVPGEKAKNLHPEARKFLKLQNHLDDLLTCRALMEVDQIDISSSDRSLIAQYIGNAPKNTNKTPVTIGGVSRAAVKQMAVDVKQAETDSRMSATNKVIDAEKDKLRTLLSSTKKKSA